MVIQKEILCVLQKGIYIKAEQFLIYNKHSVTIIFNINILFLQGRRGLEVNWNRHRTCPLGGVKVLEDSWIF